MNSKHNLDLIEEKNTTILKLTLILDKLFTVLDDFRENLRDFKNSCNCIENYKNKTNFNDLDDEYKTIINEYKQNKSKIDEELGLSSDPQTIVNRLPSLKKNRKSFEINICGFESCDYKTYDRYYLQSHIQKMHTNKAQLNCRFADCQFQCWGTTKMTEHVKNCHYDDLHNCSYDYCEFTTIYLKNLKKHISDVHKDKSVLSCNDCQFKCWGLIKLKQHLLNVHDKILLIKKTNSSAVEPKKSDLRAGQTAQDMKLYKCPICDRLYRLKYKLISHITLTHKKGFKSISKENDLFICHFPDCSFKSENRFRVFQHMRQIHFKQRFKCSLCFKAFIAKDNLNRHYKKTHLTPKTVPNITHTFVRNLGNNSGIGSEPLNVELPKTSKEFEEDLIFDISADDYFQHNQKSMWKQIDINGTTPQESCPKNSFAEEVYNTIIDKTLIKDFVFGSSLINNIRQQKREESDDKTETNNKKLKTIGPKIKKCVYKCKECDYKTEVKAVLKEHNRTFHSLKGGPSFEICNCGLKFDSTDSFTEHQSTCVKSNIYVCDNLFCVFQCSDATELSEHMKTHSVVLLIRGNNDSVNKSNYNCVRLEDQPKQHKQQDLSDQTIQQNSSHSSPSEQNPDIPIPKQDINEITEQIPDIVVKMESESQQMANPEANTMCSMAQSSNGLLQIKPEPKEADNSETESAPEQNFLSTDKQISDSRKSTLTFVTSSGRTHVSRHPKHKSFQCQLKPDLQTIVSSPLTEQKTDLHNTPAKQLFKCDVNLCNFESIDCQTFTEHKKSHLNENIDKIISEFQFGIKRVEIKTEIEEQNTVFVNPEVFLAQNTDNSPLSRSNSIDSQKNLSNDCPNQTLLKVETGCQSSSGTAKRIRGLNSVREPIRLPTKSTKKISELFKK